MSTKPVNTTQDSSDKEFAANNGPEPDPATLQNATICYNSDIVASPPQPVPNHLPVTPPPYLPISPPSRRAQPLAPESPEIPRPNPNLNTQQFIAFCNQPLTPEQTRAVDLLLLGKSDAKTAAALGVHRVTVTRWRLYNHVFQAELNRRREQIWDNAADRIRAVLARAAAVFKRQIRSDDHRVAFRAARALLQLAGSSRFIVPPDPAVAPTDPAGVMDLEARKVHVELASIDSRIDPIHDEDRALALQRLRHKLLMDPATPKNSADIPPGLREHRLPGDATSPEKLRIDSRAGEV